MTGDGWPDLTGQPAGGSMRIYPGNGVAGLKASYVAFKRIKAGVQVPVGRWDADGAPDSLFRSGKRVSLYPGNGPGGFIGARGLKLNVKRYDWMVGVGDMGINGHAGVVVREKKTGYLWLLPGDHTGVLVPDLPGAGFQGLRPGRLRMASRCRRSGSCTARRRTPGPRASAGSGGTGDQHEGAAARQRPRESGKTGRGSRVRRREESAAAGRRGPGGGPAPQLRLREVIGGPPTTGSSPVGRVPRREGIGLRPDLHADVVHSGRQRFGEPDAERPQRAGQHRHPVGVRRPTLEPRRPAHHGVGPSAPVTDSPSVQAAPRKTGPSQCVGRSTRNDCPRSRSCSSASRDAVLATQLAYVATDSSTRSSVPRS